MSLNTPGPESLTLQLDHDAEIIRARNYLTSIDAYRSFDLTSDGRIMSGCIDPRADEIGGDTQMTKMMGPGAHAGDTADDALALTVVEQRLVTIDEAQGHDIESRPTLVLGAHFDCAYVGSFWPIMGEIAQPSEQTKASVEQWIGLHELGAIVTDDVLAQVQDAASLQYEHGMLQGPPEHLVHAVDAQFPGHQNVTHMRGKATPHFYIVNHYPHLGLNRHAKHNVQRLSAQAYHDNLGARLGDIHNTHALGDTRPYRMGALLLRSAATRTVIDKSKQAAGHPLEHWEVKIGRNGPVFAPEQLT